MPRVRSFDPDEERKADIRAWLAGNMARKEMKFKELAKKTGIAESTLRYRKQYPETLKAGEYWQIARVIGGME